MQTSGTFPGLSDGVKKTIGGKTAPTPAKKTSGKGGTFVSLKPMKPTRRTK